MKVIRGTDVRFECGVKSDVTTPITTTWMKGKKLVTLGWRCVPSTEIYAMNTNMFVLELKVLAS